MRFLPLALIGLLVFAAPKPNIVVILVDDLGYGDLSSYGATDLRSPQIDTLLAQGMRFTDGYANCPVCSPTRASLLSGRYPELVGVPGVVRTHAANNWGYLAQDAVLLPNVLKKAGYDTSAIGKWHLGLRPENHPVRRGFDHFQGFLGDMMDDYYTHTRHGNHYMQDGTEDMRPKGHATDLFSSWAVDYIGRRVNDPNPFFLYLAYNAPHTPIQPPKDWLEKIKAREPDMSDTRAKLVALIEHMDFGIGQVLTAIDEFGFSDDTLVIFASDNGGQCNVGASNGALRGCKQEMYEGGIRVPMGARWPGKIAADSATDLRAMSMDIYATACEAAGADFAHVIEGKSFLPTLLGRPQTFDRDLFWTRREGGNRYMGKTIWAMRRGDWKLLQNSPMAPFELYNLQDDPAETTNVADKNRGMYNELGAALRAHMQRGGGVAWQPPVGD
ncbi:MAG: arylsulfatase A-like enzyme [Rhodothermales bacterium]|jgi:arylsulfatase A-like enzyme